MSHILVFLIKIYQRIPGPWHNACKHHPTCSNYAIGVINEFGFFKGTYLTIKRIFRCNPWSKGGYDPIPVKERGKNGKD